MGRESKRFPRKASLVSEHHKTPSNFPDDGHTDFD